MHAAAGVLTERGGMTSHAAVIGRGIGLPCVVGASDIKFQPSKKRLTTPDGRTFTEGDIITIDGTNGQVLAGQPKMVEAALDDSFQTFMKWAAENCDIRVRANADTPRTRRPRVILMHRALGYAVRNTCSLTLID